MWAYRHKKKYNDIYSFRRAIDDELEILNRMFPIPLGYREIVGIAKSVTRWVWEQYTGHGSDNKRRGICDCDPTMPLDKRQRIGQEFSAMVKSDRTLSRLKTTLHHLYTTGVSITKTNLIHYSKLSRYTINTYWSRLLSSLPFHIPLPTHSTRNSTIKTLSVTSTSNSTLNSKIPMAVGTLIPLKRTSPETANETLAQPLSLKERVRETMLMIARKTGKLDYRRYLPVDTG
jgi:hypothetical protein